MINNPPPLPNGEILNRWKVAYLDVNSSMLGAFKAQELWFEKPVFLAQTWYLAREMSAIYFAVQISEVDVVEIKEGENYEYGVQVARRKINGLIVTRDSDSKESDTAPPGTDQ